MNNYKNLYKENYTGELVFPIYTNLRLQGNRIQLIEFEKRYLLWINSRIKYYPKIVIPYFKPENYLEEYDWENSEEINIVNKFLTRLTAKYGISIMIHPLAKRYITHKGEGIKYVNIPRITTSYCGNINEVEKDKIVNEKANVALALYREGINSPSVFYSFLNFYRIINLLSPDPDIQKTWINENLNKALAAWPWGKRPLRKSHTNEGEYLYGKCRSGIAHASDLKSTRNPDSSKDDFEIREDKEVMKALAVYIINSNTLY